MATFDLDALALAFEHQRGGAASAGRQMARDDMPALELGRVGRRAARYRSDPRKIHFESVDVMRVHDGKITEHWGVGNLLSLMQQIGAWTPPPEV